MPQQNKSSQEGTQLTEANVLDYLQQHPALLMHHPQVLTVIDLPDSASGDAISLIERQIKALREQNLGLEVKMTDMVLAGQNNQRVSDALLNVAIELVNLSSRKTRIKALPTLVADQFDLLAVSVREAEAGESAYQRLEQRFAHSDSVCDHRLAAELLHYLFPDHAEEIGSVALMALKDKSGQLFAVLALAGTDKDRFRIDSGTVYLDQLARLVSVALG